MSRQKMAPVTVYVLKKDRMALLDDITDILKKERLILSSRCVDRLEDCLMAKLEPTLIPHDRNDPDRAINMAQSARLRKIKAQGPMRLEKRPTASNRITKSDRNTHSLPQSLFGHFGPPRNLHESFVDHRGKYPDSAPESEDGAEDEDEALAIVEAAKHRVESCDKPSTVSHNHFDQQFSVHKSMVSGINIASEDKISGAAGARASKKKTNTYLTARPPSKRTAFEHPPEDTTSSFYFPNTCLAFSQILPNVDQSAYSKPADMKKRADALVKKEPVDFNKNDCPTFGSRESVHSQTSNVNPAPKTVKTEAKQVAAVGHQPEGTLASVETVMTNPERTDVIAGDEKMDRIQASHGVDIGMGLAGVKNASPHSPILTITITEDTAAVAIPDTQNSTQSSSSSVSQSSFEHAQEQQDTPDTTFLSQSQDALTKSQVPTMTQDIDLKDLLQPSNPSVAGRKKKALKASKEADPVEINPRRSARLADKPKPTSTTTATKAPKAPKSTAEDALAQPPVLQSGRKRGRKDVGGQNESDGEEEEEYNGGRRKKVLSKPVVEKQRETWSKETKRGGHGRDRRTALGRHGL
ncbi:hypothetical protein ACET3X_000015 [Alternaria dauci]|uniref:Shugoshin C-terminal domain-containing protein n=1 Tax=Alternaria dauci TaxID=48095 RepID=A0ABR3UTC7_9PLEO